MSAQAPELSRTTRQDYLPEFALLLKQARLASGLTVRQLAKVVGLDHTQLVRATDGKRLSRWPLISAYLNGCGVGGGVLYSWWELWSTTRSVHLRLQNHPLGHPDDDWYWQQADQSWQRALEGLRAPDPLVIRLRQVSTLQELGVSLGALAGRNGTDSVRQVEADTNIPKSTLHAWFTGKRKPDPTRLREVVAALGATRSEQIEFKEALVRATSTTCPNNHPQTNKPCALGELHKGHHRTPEGHQWLEDDEPDPINRPRTWLTQPHLNSAGPHW
ncbi:hypothetical protein GCM10009789_84890 [Kribbella sancticallisti]|uniref:HTH cro/C1-type domain-containing protein n=1 Tax=Kribbella sancticallisti TaxID=460087 RepID=A0ABN2EUK6_9ACTN